VNKYLASFQVEWVEYSGREDDAVDFGEVVRLSATGSEIPLMMGDAFHESQQSFASDEAFQVKYL
jgi:hypothetical protein